MLLTFFLSLWFAITGGSPDYYVIRQPGFDMSTRQHPDLTNHSGGGSQASNNRDAYGNLR